MMKHVHLVGVSGTGMGALAMLFRERGLRVTGSDVAFDPPIGPALAAAGIECLTGYEASHLDPAPDLVVVGNAIRKDNAEARAAEARGLPRASMSSALREHFLAGRRAVVVTGTHGKTTTSAMCAWLLAQADLDPGFFIGGIPKGFGVGARAGASKRRLLAAGTGKAPFVVEGDEYDAVYWHKKAKFLDYVGASEDDVVILTSVEHDHIDIYPTPESYEAAFRELAAAVPAGGLLLVDASQPRAVAIAHESRARVVHYALDRDATGDVTPEWVAAVGAVDDLGRQEFDAFVGGASCGRFALRVPGAHNVRNALAALAMSAEAFGVPSATARAALGGFEGVKRRQDLLGTPAGVNVYDDFAHHPTAVAETLAALRRRHPAGTLWAVFEPRSATACRSLHQQAYASAFGAAGRVLLAPLGRTNVPEAERLDTGKLAADIGAGARATGSVDAIVAILTAEAAAGDTVALLSNGAFAGLHGRLLAALAAR